MNVFLWVLQGLLALLALSGGAYKLFGFDAVAKEPFFAALPRAGWSAVGVFEVVCAVLLIAPAATGWMPTLTPLSAAALLLESLALAALYARYSRQLTAANPLVWVLLIAVMAALVAYGRFASTPPG